MHSRAHCTPEQTPAPQRNNSKCKYRPDRIEVDFDDEIFEHEADEAPGEAKANTMSKHKQRRQAAKIEELCYREYFVCLQDTY